MFFQFWKCPPLSLVSFAVGTEGLNNHTECRSPILNRDVLSSANFSSSATKLWNSKTLCLSDYANCCAIMFRSILENFCIFLAYLVREAVFLFIYYNWLCSFPSEMHRKAWALKKYCLGTKRCLVATAWKFMHWFTLPFGQCFLMNVL